MLSAAHAQGAEQGNSIVHRAVYLSPSFDAFGPVERAAWHLGQLHRDVGRTVPLQEAMLQTRGGSSRGASPSLLGVCTSSSSSASFTSPLAPHEASLCREMDVGSDAVGIIPDGNDGAESAGRRGRMLVPPTKCQRGSEVWFLHKRHRVVFVVDTSPRYLLRMAVGRQKCVEYEAHDALTLLPVHAPHPARSFSCSMRTLRGTSGVPPLSDIGAALTNCFKGIARYHTGLPYCFNTSAVDGACTKTNNIC